MSIALSASVLLDARSHASSTGDRALVSHLLYRGALAFTRALGSVSSMAGKHAHLSAEELAEFREIFNLVRDVMCRGYHADATLCSPVARSNHLSSLGGSGQGRYHLKG